MAELQLLQIFLPAAHETGWFIPDANPLSLIRSDRTKIIITGNNAGPYDVTVRPADKSSLKPISSDPAAQYLFSNFKVFVDQDDFELQLFDCSYEKVCEILADLGRTIGTLGNAVEIASVHSLEHHDSDKPK